MMKNVSVVVTNNNTIVVVADTKRYGKQAILYEDHKFMRCFDYIRRASGQNHFQIKSYSTSEQFTDTDGRTMARFMWIVF